MHACSYCWNFACICRPLSIQPIQLTVVVVLVECTSAICMHVIYMARVNMLDHVQAEYEIKVSPPPTPTPPKLGIDWLYMKSIDKPFKL